MVATVNEAHQHQLARHEQTLIICVSCFKETDAIPQTKIHLVALHTYESSNPEDLSFKEGDSIDLLSRGENLLI